MNTFSKPKDERIIETRVTREEKQALRKTLERKKRDDKKGGKTNEQHARMKAMSMLMPKKLRALKDKFKTIRERVNKIKYGQGKIKQGNLRVHRKIRLNK